jgi:hypothetical protein
VRILSRVFAVFAFTRHQLVVAHGRGACTWTNGDVYEGDFLLDVLWGWGRLKRKEGMYEGQIKDSEKVACDV